MIGYIEGGKRLLFYDPDSRVLISSEIARFPYKNTVEQTGVVGGSHNQPTLPTHPNKITNHDQPDKGSLQHIINTPKLGEFDEEVKLDMQDVATTHTLDRKDYLKLLKPPQSYAEAMRSADSGESRKECDAQMAMMEQMKVWKLVQKPEGLVPIDLKWVFNYKKVDNNGNPIKFKSRLVEKGFSQREGIEYTENFAPTATFAGLLIMLKPLPHTRNGRYTCLTSRRPISTALLTHWFTDIYRLVIYVKLRRRGKCWWL